MSAFGFGHEVVTSTTKPANPSVGQLIYCSDTDEYLKYASYGGANRWMQAVLKPGRNRLINGGFDVWQRGTSKAASGSGITDYSADRWAFGNNNTGSYTVSRQTNVPLTRHTYSARVTCTNASYGLNGFVQFVEDINVIPLRGSYVTLSFWVRGGTAFNGAGVGVNTGTTANQNPGVGNAFTGNVSLINTGVNITSSWQYFSLTSAAVVPDTAAVMSVYLPKPTTFALNDWVEYAGVQLEIGTAPSEFEFRPYDDELRRCQRYYQRYNAASTSDYIGGLQYYATDRVFGPIYFLKVPLRVAPTSAAISSAAHISVYNSTGSTGAPGSSVTVQYNSNNSVVVNGLVLASANGSAGANYMAYWNSTSGWVEVSAEL